MIEFESSLNGRVFINPYAVSSVALEVPHPRPSRSYEEQYSLRYVRVNLLDGGRYCSDDLKIADAEKLRDEFLAKLAAFKIPPRGCGVHSSPTQNQP